MNNYDYISRDATLWGDFLNRIGLDRETAPSLWIALFGSLIISGAILLTYGNVLAGVAILFGMSFLAITFLRIDISFFMLVGMVLLFDQFKIPGFRPITLRVHYFMNIKQISYLPHIGAAVFNPIEVHLMLIILTYLAVIALKRKVRFQGIPVWPAYILFFAWFIFAFINGQRQGGQFLEALWEVRALFYLGIMYLLVPQIIQNRHQLRIMIWIYIIMVSIKAFQGIERFVKLGFSYHGYQTLTNHEDPVFTVILIMFLIALYLFKVKDRQRTALLWLLFPLLLGFLVGQRRAAYASFIVVFIAFIVLLKSPDRRRLMKFVIPLVIFIGIYSAVFWNSTSSLAGPVQQIKSGLFPTDKKDAGNSYDSNLYRVHEDYDLAYTVRQVPLVGLGFGRKYKEPVSLVKISFPLRDYIPHNEIFWMLVKTGGIGFFFFWFFFNSFACNGVIEFKKLKDPYLKAVCAIIILAIINQMVVSFFDLQLTYYRNMIFLGVLMGLLPTVVRLDKEAREQKTGIANSSMN